MKNKITVGLILSWIFGAFFALLAFIFVFSEPIPAFILLFMAMVILPPIHKRLHERWEVKLSRGLKVTALSFGFVAFSYAIDTPVEPEVSEKLSEAEASAVNEPLEISEGSESEIAPIEEQTQNIPTLVIDSEVKEALNVQEKTPEKGVELVSSIPENRTANLAVDETYGEMANEVKDEVEIPEAPVNIPEPPAIIPEPPAPEHAPPAPSCDTNYTGCVPIASDVDCGGGKGDGPGYFYGVAEVIGRDVYDLDRDNDGWACE